MHKKRKWVTAATDEIDALFEGAFGRKVTQSALKQETAQSLLRLEAKDTRHGGAGGSESVCYGSHLVLCLGTYAYLYNVLLVIFSKCKS